mgnify:CR=1 FL=1
MIKYAGGFLVALVLLLGGLRFLQPTLAATFIGTDDDSRVAISFWPAQTGSEGPYRWTTGDSQLQLRGLERWNRAVLVFRTQAPRPFAVEIANTGTLSMTAHPEWRVYRVFTTPNPGDAIVAHISGPVDHAGDYDLRRVGVPMNLAAALPLGPPAWMSIMRRSVFVLLLSLLGLLLVQATPLRGWAWLVPPLAATGFLVLTTVQPALTSYWLPSLWTSVTLGVTIAGVSALARSRPAWSTVILAHWLVPALGTALAGAILLALPTPFRMLGAPLLLGGALVAGWQLPRRALPVPRRRWTVGILLLALIVAGAARLTDLDRIPFGLWRDEAAYGLVAQQINADPGYWPVYIPNGIDYPAFLMYLIALVIKIRGAADSTSVRLVAALAGTLMPLVLYVFGRHLVGRWPACIAALLLSWLTWHVAISRISFVAVLEPVFTVSGLALLWQALHSPPEARRRWIWFALAGTSFGTALYTYHTARLLPVLALALAWSVLGRSWTRWRAALPGALVTIGVATLILLPLLHYAVTESEAFNLRVGETSVIRSADQQTVPVMAALNENVSRYVLMWNVTGEPNARHYVPKKPMLDPLTGAAFLVGVLGLLIRRRQPAETFLLIWLGLELVPALLAEGAPHAVRSVGVIAPALLLAAQALVRVWTVLPTQKIGVFLLAGLAICGFYNLNLYFSTVPTSPAVWEKFYTEETALAQYASTAPGPVVVPRTVMETAVGAYLLAGKPVQVWDVGQTDVSFSPGTTLLIPNGATAEEYEWIATHFPDIQRLPHSPFPGTVQPTFWSYTVWR